MKLLSIIFILIILIAIATGKICELVADALDQLLLSCQHLFNIASLS